MNRIEIADTVSSASNYELDDGRIFRVHMKLMTPEAQLATADYVEVETRGYEILKNGAFVVDDNGLPVEIAPQRARIPLSNVRSGADSVKPGWIKQTLPEDEAARETALAEHKKLKNLPKSGEPGDVVRVGDELYSYTDGLYEQVRRQRVAAIAQQAASKPEPLDAEVVASLRP